MVNSIPCGGGVRSGPSPSSLELLQKSDSWIDLIFLHFLDNRYTHFKSKEDVFLDPLSSIILTAATYSVREA